MEIHFTQWKATRKEETLSKSMMSLVSHIESGITEPLQNVRIH